ncbi:40S ribosomal protein S9 [Plectosphaerella plurivora]|uniref:Small ribosomal subunit protein uS9m n=1 Tax=Plectosphaerella plurivora TaxID=936078 RepID=A0A9P8V8S6_9PEZI|nr:40S ribosomal protein S9 [Plectosphaerella plurivora]
MSSLRLGYQQLRCVRQFPNSLLQRQQWASASASQVSRRHLTTTPTLSQATRTDVYSRLAKAEEEGADGWLRKQWFSPEDIAASGIRPQPVPPFENVEHARPVPTTPSYFTRQPYFNDALIRIAKLYKKYEHLPTAPPERVVPQSWKTLNEYKAICGEPIKAMPFSTLLGMVKKMHTIEPDMVPAEVTDAIREFKRGIDAHLNVAKPLHIDRFGRAVGTGRRKASTARAWVVEGTGEVQINGKPLSEAFGRVHDRESAIWALHSTERTDKYNVWALVEGGGTTGQAEALTLAIAKALLAHEPGLKQALRQAGCVTRDKRTVERKKHGHLKARKMPAWNRR